MRWTRGRSWTSVDPLSDDRLHEVFPEVLCDVIRDRACQPPELGVSGGASSS